MTENKDLILIGKITTSHGIKGEVKIKSYTENPEDIFNYNLYDKTGDIKYILKKTGSYKKDIFISKINNLKSRNESDLLRGENLYIKKTDLKTPPKNSFYINELKNLKVLNSDEQEIGYITGFNNFGAGNLIEIKLNKNNKTYYINFNKNTIIEINKEKGYIQINEEYIV